MKQYGPWLAIPLLALTGCNSDNDTSSALETERFTVNILHINDHHSHLEAGSQSLTIAGAETEFSAGGFPRVITKINERAAELDNVLDRKSTRLNSSHVRISYAVFCLKKKKGSQVG